MAVANQFGSHKKTGIRQEDYDDGRVRVSMGLELLSLLSYLYLLDTTKDTKKN